MVEVLTRYRAMLLAPPHQLPVRSLTRTPTASVTRFPLSIRPRLRMISNLLSQASKMHTRSRRQQELPHLTCHLCLLAGLKGKNRRRLLSPPNSRPSRSWNVMTIPTLKVIEMDSTMTLRRRLRNPQRKRTRLALPPPRTPSRHPHPLHLQGLMALRGTIRCYSP